MFQYLSFVWIAWSKNSKTQDSTLLALQEVVIERVLRVLLITASQILNKLSTDVRKATLNWIPATHTATESQATVSRSMRDHMVQTILTGIREMYTQHTLHRCCSLNLLVTVKGARCFSQRPSVCMLPNYTELCFQDSPSIISQSYFTFVLFIFIHSLDFFFSGTQTRC